MARFYRNGGTGGSANIADFVFTNEGEEDSSSVEISNKDMILRTVRNDEETDADIVLNSADDIFIEAQGDDLSISANNSVRINAYNDNVEINAAGYTIFYNSDVYLLSENEENKVATIGDLPSGATGSFATVDGKSVTVTNGIITAIDVI